MLFSQYNNWVVAYESLFFQNFNDFLRLPKPIWMNYES